MASLPARSSAALCICLTLLACEKSHSGTEERRPAADPAIAAQECSKGQAQEQSCGPTGRGSQTRDCRDGSFGEWSVCSFADGCLDGSREYDACGLNQRGQTQRTCRDAAWNLWTDCVDLDECVDGVSESRACGPNQQGNEQRECTQGRFTTWSSCAGPEGCKNGEIETRGCGANHRGTQTRTCSAARWQAFTTCVDVDVCTDGAEQSHSCGINLRGAQSQTCLVGAWSALSLCNDLDVCKDGVTHTLACGLNGRGIHSRVCTSGQWSAFDPCNDPDDCKNGEGETVACGMGGTALRACVEGRWAARGECSQLCGNSKIEGAEQCDDGNSAQGDGCYGCKTELVKWASQLDVSPGMDVVAGGPLHDGSFLFVGRLRASAASLYLVRLAADGHEQFRYALAEGTSELRLGGIRFDAARERIVMSGLLRGRSTLLQLTSPDVLQPWIAAVAGDGQLVHSGMFATNVASTLPIVIRAEAAGDVVLSYSLPLNDQLSFRGAPLLDARTAEPGWAGALALIRFDTDGKLLFAGLLLTEALDSRSPVFAADAERTLIGFRRARRVQWGAQTVTATDAVMSLDRQGRVQFMTPISVPGLGLSVHPLSPDGAAVVLEPTLPSSPNDGSETLLIDGAGRVIHTAQGALLRTRSDGTLALRGWFQGERFTLAAGTAYERTLVSSRPEATSSYVARYRRDGALLDASVIASASTRPSNARIAAANAGFALAIDCSDRSVLGAGTQAVEIPSLPNQTCLARFDEAAQLVWWKAFPYFSDNYLSYPNIVGDDVWFVAQVGKVGAQHDFDSATTITSWNAQGQLSYGLKVRPGFLQSSRVALTARDGEVWAQLQLELSDQLFPDEPGGGFWVGEGTTLAKLRLP